MTDAADLALLDGEVHTLAEPDATREAVAVRDGAICRVGRTAEVRRLVGVETTVVDLAGRTLLPGFVDAHTHLPMLGRYLVHADLRGADGPDDCVERLRASADERRSADERASGREPTDDDGDRAGDAAPGADDWVLGFGFDETGWDEPRYLDRTDLDRVSAARPVAAFREDMHVAAVNGVALERHADAMPAADVRTEAGEPTGVLVEEAVDVVYRAIEPDRAATERLLRAAQAEATRRGVTGVHDMVRRSHAPAVYRALDRAGDLALRVRLNYWSDHLDALEEAGLGTNDGAPMVRVGAVKTYTDGSLGGRTARLHEPYADAHGRDDESDGGTGDDGLEDAGTTGQWVVPPDDLAALVERADAAGRQVAAHAIGDAAVDAVLDAYAATDDPAAARHRVEHAELVDDAALDRLADLGAVASVQPNFLKWAGPGGLYERRLGPERGAATNRYRDLLDAGVPLAFGSDCMPLDPLLGVHHAVHHPTASQRLSVTEALRAYTRGGAFAGFDEDRLGTVAVGTRADLVALDGSPWEAPDAIRDLEVALTVVDGRVVYDGR